MSFVLFAAGGGPVRAVAWTPELPSYRSQLWAWNKTVSPFVYTSITPAKWGKFKCPDSHASYS